MRRAIRIKLSRNSKENLYSFVVAARIQKNSIQLSLNSNFTLALLFSFTNWTDRQFKETAAIKKKIHTCAVLPSL